MSNAVSNYSTYFHSRVKQAFQGTMKLKPCVSDYGSINGGLASFPRYNSGEATAYIPGQPVQAQSATESPATANISHFAYPIWAEEAEIMKVAYDMIEARAEVSAKAISRQCDQYIIQAMENGVSNDRKIAVGAGDQAGLTKAKVLQAMSYLNAVEGDMADRYLAITPGALEDLLGINEFVSGDYVNQMRNTLQKGEIAEIAGFKVMMIGNRRNGGLPTSTKANNSTATRKLYAWQKMSVGFVSLGDIKSRVSLVPENRSYLIDTTLDGASTVIDKAGVIEISTSETYIAAMNPDGSTD